MGYPCHNEAIPEFFQIQVGHVQPPLDIRPVLVQPLTTLNSRFFFFSLQDLDLWFWQGLTLPFSDFRF